MLIGSFACAVLPEIELGIPRHGQCKHEGRLTAEIQVQTNSSEHAEEILRQVCYGLGHEVAEPSERLHAVLRSEAKAECAVNNGETVMAEISVEAIDAEESEKGARAGCSTWNPGQILHLRVRHHQ